MMPVRQVQQPFVFAVVRLVLASQREWKRRGETRCKPYRFSELGQPTALLVWRQADRVRRETAVPPVFGKGNAAHIDRPAFACGSRP